MQDDGAILREPGAPGLYERFAALVDADGSGAHPVVAHLRQPRVPNRDLADALHCLCLLHGRDAGVVAVAHARSQHPVAREWFAVAADAFSAERDWLSRLVAGAGPVPSTPGQTETENAIATQRHALVMLAQSERRGVATGAAAALIHDWQALRPMLEATGRRLDVACRPTRLPSAKVSQALLDSTPVGAVEERGFLFGAQQYCAQQRGLLGLIEARLKARALG